MKTKVCSKCGIEKDRGEFYKDESTKCKQCVAKLKEKILASLVGLFLFIMVTIFAPLLLEYVTSKIQKSTIDNTVTKNDK